MEPNQGYDEKPNNLQPSEAQPSVPPGPPSPVVNDQPTIEPAPPLPSSVQPPASSVVVGHFDALGSVPAAVQTAPLVAPQVNGQALGGGPAVTASSKKSLLKPLLLSLAAILVLAVGSAAAYVGYIEPNQPANVLKAAVLNTLQQKQIDYSGELTADPSNANSGLAAKLDFDGGTDLAAKTSDTTFTFTVSGVNLGGEARYVNQNIYIKLGDLSTITSLLNSFGPSSASLSQALNKQLSNQWIVFDSTLLKQAGLSCLMDANTSLSSSDLNLLKKQYAKNNFTTIKSSGNDTVNGQPAEKYFLLLDHQKLASFVNSLNGLGPVKAINACQTDHKAALNVKGDNQATPMSVWVDKKTKRLDKLVIDNNTQGEATNLQLNLSYKPVSVSAPANAESAVSVLANLSKASGGSIPANPNINNLFSSGGSTNVTLTQ